MKIKKNSLHYKLYRLMANWWIGPGYEAKDLCTYCYILFLLPVFTIITSPALIIGQINRLFPESAEAKYYAEQNSFYPERKDTPAARSLMFAICTVASLFVTGTVLITLLLLFNSSEALWCILCALLSFCILFLGAAVIVDLKKKTCPFISFED
jgi:hypothetical protein